MKRRVDPLTFVDHIRDLAQSQPAELAYTWLGDGDEEEASLTFSELDAEARKVAAQLDEWGLAGERALLLYSPGLEFIAAFFGCMYAGVVPVPSHSPQSRIAVGTTLAIAGHAKPAVLLTDSGLLTQLQTSGQVEALAGMRILATDTLPKGHGLGWRPGDVRPDDLAFLQYTSGSTGTPKGVEVTHGNLIQNQQMIREGFGNGPDTVFVSWLPLFHDMGLVGNTMQPLFLGVHCVMMSPAAFVQRPLRWLRALSRYGGTVSGSPNFGYDLCVKRVPDEAVAELDLRPWRVAYNGSEPVRASTLERFAQKFAPAGFRREALYPCYGMAEASLFVTGGVAAEPYVVLDVDAAELQRNRIRPVSRHAGAGEETRRLVGCGRPWLDQEVLIVDPETRQPTPADEIGEIWIRGGNVARGYRNLPPDEPDPFRAMLASGDGPFFRTGDLGFLRGGELFVTGRIKDILILKGRNHYPQDIEDCAGSSHPYLRPGCSAAFTVEQGDEEHLVVVQEVDRQHRHVLARRDADGEALRKELIGAVRRAVSRDFGLHVRDVVLIGHGQIHKTSSGKIRRRMCRSQWLRGELGAPEQAVQPVGESEA